MFKKVLIANRGEIAVRIIRTLRSLGIRSVAVYSDADRESVHTLIADEAVNVGPAPAIESYLSIEKIIVAAKKVSADSIHPGYGFLSENSQFSKACSDSGIVFIGSSPESMAKLGSKEEAKRIAKQLGIPLVEGLESFGSLSELESWAKRSMYPVLLKAVAGGGGKGMRKVEKSEDLKEAVEAAKREASSSFGNDRLMAEKYLYPARHVEIQVLADKHGNVLAFPERECSLQRRHQKVIEESPSTVVDNDLRSKLQGYASSIIKYAGYYGAATVEFLIDQSGSIYFLEVNTRLQVEHPVTEMVTGLDLVELQLESSSGLSFNGRSVGLSGHSVEARLYAEDPLNNFLPSTGKITELNWPVIPGVRVDYGVTKGQSVTPYYDPMIAKIISHGENRTSSRSKLVQALRDTIVLGVQTNQEFLLSLAESEFYKQGNTFTRTIDEHLSSLVSQMVPREILLIAAYAELFESKAQSGVGGKSFSEFSPWKQLGGWTL